MRRFASVFAVSIVLAASTSVSGPVPEAHASTASSPPQLRQQLQAGTDPVITLTGTVITPDDEPYVVSRDVTVDLNGFLITTGSVQLDPGVTLTIVDSRSPAGTWEATGRAGEPGFDVTDATLVIRDGSIRAAAGLGGAAGIGGRAGQPGGSLTVEGGWVEARATTGAAIGGGEEAAGGVTQISGGTVIARSSGGAAIGAGRALVRTISPILVANGGSTTISGGNVSGFTDGFSAAIGGSGQAGSGTIRITGGTIRTVTFGDAPAIGSGAYSGVSADVTIGSTSGAGPIVTTEVLGIGPGIGVGVETPQNSVFFVRASEAITPIVFRSARYLGGLVSAPALVDDGAQLELGEAEPTVALDTIVNRGTITLRGILELRAPAALINEGTVIGEDLIVGGSPPVTLPPPSPGPQPDPTDSPDEPGTEESSSQQPTGRGEDGDDAGLMSLPDRGGLAFTGAPASTAWLVLLGLVLITVGTAVVTHRRRDPVVITR